MKKLEHLTILGVFVLGAVSDAVAQAGLYSSANLYVDGTTLFVHTNMSNDAGGTIHNAGTVRVTGNFNNSGTPAIDEHVILEGTGNQLVTGNSLFNDILEINKTAGIATVSSGQTEVLGQLRLAEGQINANDRLVIKSTPLRTGLVDDFSDPTYDGVITNRIRVQRFLPSPEGNRFHFIGSAVNTPLVAELASDIGLYGNQEMGQIIPEPDCNPDHVNVFSPYGNLLEWHEDGPWTVPGCTQSGWYVRVGNYLTNGRGYSVLTGNVTVEIGGTVNTSEVTNMSYSGLAHTNATGNGWHLVSNPFPSPILWSTANYNLINSFSAGSFIGGIAIYVPTGLYSGTYQTYSPVDNELIALGQGLMIQVLPGPTVDWTLPQDVRSLGDPTFFKTEINNRFDIVVKTANFADKTSVRFGNEGQTVDLDPAFDGSKILSPNAQPTIYTRLRGHNFSINSLPLQDYPMTIPLDLTPGVSGEFTFTAEHLSSFEVEAHVYLEDLLTGAIQELTVNPNYKFSANESDDPERFLLHFRLNGDEPMLIGDEDAGILMYANNGEAHIFLPEVSGKSTLQVFNAMGALVYEKSGLSEGKNTVDLRQMSTGAYILQVVVNEEVHTRKVIL